MKKKIIFFFKYMGAAISGICSHDYFINSTMEIIYISDIIKCTIKRKNVDINNYNRSMILL